MFAVWTRFLQPEELLVVAEQRRVRSGASELADPAAPSLPIISGRTPSIRNRIERIKSNVQT